MWRLWRLLFGGDWVNYSHAPAWGQWYTRRVAYDGDGRPFVMVYGHHEDLATTTGTWRPLTCPREQLVAPAEGTRKVGASR